ncbi:hypothetical protein BDR22DRAFT_867705 [Usnea florida]
MLSGSALVFCVGLHVVYTRTPSGKGLRVGCMYDWWRERLCWCGGWCMSLSTDEMGGLGESPHTPLGCVICEEVG